MPYPYDQPRNRPTRRHTADFDSPMNHTTRSWSDNGVHYTVETASYSIPNISIGMMGGAFDAFQPTPRTHNSSILGTALGLLGNVLAVQQQAAIQGNSRRSVRRPLAEDLAYGEDGSIANPQSFMSRFAETLRHNSQRSQRATHSRDPKIPGARRSRSYRTEEREPSWTNDRAAYVEDFSEDEDDEYGDVDSDEHDIPYERQPRRVYTAHNVPVIEALQNAVEHHRRQAQNCRERMQQISSQPRVSTAVLQSLLNELRSHEKAYETALQSLQLEEEGVRSRTHERKAPRRVRHSNHGHIPRSSDDEFFDAFSQHEFVSFFQARRPTHHVSHDFDGFDPFGGTPFTAFHRLFNDFGAGSPRVNDPSYFFGMPRATFSTRSSGRTNGTRAQQPTSFSSFAQPRQSPPANLLKPEEAQRLFVTYNERWNALGPTDPYIPYPARGLQSAALVARDSIWAPLVSSPVADWSEEAVMQANAQAFFLGAVGLLPNYTEAPGTGRIVMGLNKTKTSAAQLKTLIDVLKKEKIRWHSDRLGRRNRGVGGPNEALQSDTKSRAVFHAVCELMEAAQ